MTPRLLFAITLLGLVGCSSTTPPGDAGVSTDAGADTSATPGACIPVSEKGGEAACTARGCSALSRGTGGSAVVVCTKRCTPNGPSCGDGQVCANLEAADPSLPADYYCLVKCDDPRCAAPLVCDQAIKACN